MGEAGGCSSVNRAVTTDFSTGFTVRLHAVRVGEGSCSVRLVFWSSCQCALWHNARCVGSWVIQVEQGYRISACACFKARHTFDQE
jgi:hypothetical protein